MKRVIVERRINKINKEYNTNFQLETFDNELNKVSQKVLTEALNNFFCESTDIKIMIRKKPHIIEFDVCDNGVSLFLYTLEEYINKYGEDILYQD